MKAKTQHSSPWKGISWRKVTRTVDRREAGTYEISELLREFWPWEKRPHLYGRVFKWLVLQGWFDRVRWAGERSKRSTGSFHPRVSHAGPARRAEGGAMAKKTKKESWHALSPSDVATATELVRARGPGRWTVKELYGDGWQRMSRPRRFGVLFKRAVLGGALEGIG